MSVESESRVATQQKSNPSTGTPEKRRRTGATKRARRLRVGPPRPADERKVTTQEQGRAFLENLGRSHLARGGVLRVSPRADAAAFANIEIFCRDNEKALGERLLGKPIVGGARGINDELIGYLGPVPQLGGTATKGKGKEPAAEDEPTPSTQDLMLEAHNFLSSHRKAIARVAKGPANAKTRRAFGIHRPVTAENPASIARGISDLLAGQAQRPGSAAANCLTSSDLKKARSLCESLNAVQQQKQSTRGAQKGRTRRIWVLQAALEAFYDRFVASCESAFAEDDELRLAGLALVPMRAQHAPPAPKSDGEKSSSSTASGTRTSQPGPNPVAAALIQG